MITFILSILALLAGYWFYSRFIDRFFGASKDAVTPVNRLADGVDYIPMPVWKMFTIQFLNIAGLGPIFGAVLGAMYGPASYVWIVLGCIFMGAVHDYFSGMLSIRNNGMSLPEMVGKYLGPGFLNFLRYFSLLLLVMVGVAFVNGPAGLLHSMTGDFLIFGLNVNGFVFWLVLIFAYYILATLLPINKIIGRIYPVFGVFLLFMAVAVGGYLLFQGFNGNLVLAEISFSNLRNTHHDPVNNILYPMMFVIVSCGAISGFHSTQSPMMARCMTNEKQGRKVFYGAMIAEGIVTLIWATAAMNFFGDANALNQTMAQGHNPAWVVNLICYTWLGKIGAVLAIIGVIVCPITTGDTAFRSARLTVADMFKLDQHSMKKRLIITLPLFVVGFFLSQIKFEVIWKYVGLSNQILAVIVLWTGAMYLVGVKKLHWMLSLPAAFMTVICLTYLLAAPYSNGGLFLPVSIAYPLGMAGGIASFFWFLHASRKTVAI